MNIIYVVLYKFMVKRKKSIEVVEDLADEIKTEEIDVDPQKEIERKRKELIKLAEDGQFEKNVNTIKKASNKIIEKYYKEYERKRMQKQMNF